MGPLEWYKVCSTLEQIQKTHKRPERLKKLKAIFEEHRRRGPPIVNVDVNGYERQIDHLLACAKGKEAEEQGQVVRKIQEAARKAKGKEAEGQDAWVAKEELRAAVAKLNELVHGAHMYSLIRLLLPQLDRNENGENVLYNMKEAKIARAFVTALDLPPKVGDSLKNWRKPEGGEGYGVFSNVLYHQLKERVSKTGQKVTIQDINDFLDGMAKAVGDEQLDLIKNLANSASAFELKWIARLLLRELKQGVTEELVFKAYHEDASELFKVDARLRHVVNQCYNPKHRLGQACIQVNKAFKPMLAEKTQNLEQAYFDRVFTKTKGIFWIEPKYDGERMIVHMANGALTCYTRNCNDSTKLYGPFLKKLEDCIKTKTCILDAEILGRNKTTRQWVPYGNNVTLAHMENGQLPGGRLDAGGSLKGKEILQDAHLCVVLFDVLLIGEEKLENLPLWQRRERLRKLVDFEKLKAKKMDHVLEVVEHTETSSSDVVKEKLYEVVLQGDEGLMLKDPSSTYKATVREKSGWWKLKPEYIAGGTQEYDCIIIGGTFASNNRAGKMWGFVCGIAEKRFTDSKYPTTFVSMARVGTGLKHEGFRELEMKLQDLKRDYDPKRYLRNAPPTRDRDMTIERTDKGVRVTFSKQTISGEELPEVSVWFAGNAKEEVDVVFDPRKSVVLTLLADYRLTEGDVWMTGREPGGKKGWTLRFPRIAPRGIRDSSLGGTDKPWHDVMNTEAFAEQIRSTKDGCQSFKNENAENIRKALEGVQTIFDKRKKPAKARRQAPAVSDRFQIEDLKDVEIKSDALNGCIVYVLPAAADSIQIRDRNETIKQAHILGATIVGNHDRKDTFVTHIIGMCEDQKFQTYKKEDVDVIDRVWIAECHEEFKEVPLQPRHFMYISKQRKEEFSSHYDCYEDSYNRDIAPGDLRDKLDKDELWIGMKYDGFDSLSQGKVCEIEDELRENLNAAADKIDKKAREENARQQDSLQQQQPLSLYGASLEPSLPNDDDRDKEVHDLLHWSLFRDVSAAILDYSDCMPASSMVPDVADMVMDKDINTSWIPLAKAQLEAGGGQVAMSIRNITCPNGTARVTHVVCSEMVLRRNRGGVQTFLDEHGLAHAILISDKWIDNCFRRKQRFDHSDDYLYTSWAVSPQSASSEERCCTHRHSFVSSPFSDHDCRDPEDRRSPDWIAVKVQMHKERGDGKKFREYPNSIEITDGDSCWSATTSNYTDFECLGKLQGECLNETWGPKVCSVLKFPWGSTVKDAGDPRMAACVKKGCIWRFSDCPDDWRRRNWADWGAGENGRELCVTWPNDGGTHSSFVMWLKKVHGYGAVRSIMMDVTRLLVSQTQHASSDIHGMASWMTKIHRLQTCAEDSLKKIDGNDKKDTKLLTCAGAEYINTGKRVFNQLEEDEARADEAAGYDTDERLDSEADSECQEGNISGVKPDGIGPNSSSLTGPVTAPKPRPRKKANVGKG